MVIDTIFQQPVWSLARGDVFKKPVYIRLLTALHILPVYRTSEGVENLSENYKTFEACISLFRRNGIITIFSEGKCINEWHLRPLKKGTARLACKAWEEGIPLRVIPVSINYSSFRLFGKNIFIRFGKPVGASDLDMLGKDGPRHQAFNTRLEAELKKGVMEITANDLAKKKALLEVRVPLLKKIILSVPALAGYLLHAPLFLPVKSLVYKRTVQNDHYDSVLIAILLLTYPIYLLLLTLAASFWAGGWSLLLFLLLPFTAWSYVQVCRQLDA